MKVSTKFNVDTTICCLVIELLLLIRYMTSWPWHLTFWPWSVVIHGGSRGQSIDQVWGSLRLSVLELSSSDISYRIPLTMRLQPLRMRRITWPMRRWQIFPAYLKSLTSICLFTISGVAGPLAAWCGGQICRPIVLWIACLQPRVLMPKVACSTYSILVSNIIVM